MFKKIITIWLLAALLLPTTAFADTAASPEEDNGDPGATTLLPEGDPDMTAKDCNDELAKYQTPDSLKNEDEEKREQILACAIKTGRIRLWMLPYFISYIANFFINVAGVISMLFVVIGGFWYMTGGITDDKEKGKKTIFYALVGLVITLLAWIIVNVIQVQVTG